MQGVICSEQLDIGMNKAPNFRVDEFSAFLVDLKRPMLDERTRADLIISFHKKYNQFFPKDIQSSQLRVLNKLIKDYAGSFVLALESIMAESNFSLNNECKQILRNIGSPSVDLGLKFLDDRNSVVAEIGEQILYEIQDFGIERLRTLLTSDNPSKKGIKILKDIDPDGLSYFRNQLEDVLGEKNQVLARYGIDAIRSIGDFSIPLLLEMLGSNDPFKQQNSTNALIALGEIAVQDIIEELDNPIPTVQQNAIRALKQIGPDAIPALKLALESSSQLIVQNASIVLKDIKPSPAATKIFGWLGRKS